MEELPPWRRKEGKKAVHPVERKRPRRSDSEEGAEQYGDLIQVPGKGIVPYMKRRKTRAQPLITMPRSKFRARPGIRLIKEEKEDGDDTMPTPPTQQDSRPTQPRSSASSPRTFWYTPEGYMAENSFVMAEGSDRSTEEQSESEEIEMGVWGTTGATLRPKMILWAQKQRRMHLAVTRLRQLQQMDPGTWSIAHGAVADVSITESTLRDYLQRLNRFWDYVLEEDLETGDDTGLDKALAGFCNQDWVNGELSHEGEKLRVAYEAAYPDAKHKMHHLVSTITDWKKGAPGGKRHDIPESAVDLMTSLMVERDQMSMGLYIQLTFSLFARPGETMKLRIKDVVPPVKWAGKKMQNWSILLAPLEGLATTSSGPTDEALVLDDVRAPWLGEALSAQIEKRRLKLKGQGKSAGEIAASSLWDFTTAEVLEEFQHGLKYFNLGGLAQPTLYLLRHGGASRDVALGTRALPDVQRRGRWAHVDSVRHYKKQGRLPSLVHQMGPAALKHAWQLRVTFANVFLK